MPKKTPVYIRIHNDIRNRIESHKWEVGDKIPSERDLAIDFGVSRMTVRQAVQSLVEEGILERKVGSGTFVSREKVKEKMSGIQGFTDTILQQGRVPSSKVMAYHVKPASSSESDKLQIKEGAEVLKMERIRFADDIPICYEVASIPLAIIKNLNKKQITQSLYHTLKNEKNISIKRAEQTVSAMLASESTAELLDLKKGEAILRLRQVSFDQMNQPIEYVRTQYAGNRFEFYLEAKK
ncbi:GntR family transcriptional regulator [Lacticigenium naphthae]|uniref:GntR family transcriptional regulator n=1 Tax=Lacticigenium naphthae TaxID=515351 RepID=UPI0003FAA43F|nr:GntR family transcriptional regulator [Lacticigenium naphthae]